MIEGGKELSLVVGGGWWQGGGTVEYLGRFCREDEIGIAG